jgi:hypothetical protein
MGIHLGSINISVALCQKENEYALGKTSIAVYRLRIQEEAE